MPIVQSLADTDFYKITMGQFIRERYSCVPVTFRLINRSDERLLDYIDDQELRAEIEHVKTLRWKDDELHFLYREGFSPRYLDFLRTLRLPDVDVDVRGDDVAIMVRGAWPVVTHWEIPILQIVSELYIRGLRDKRGLSEKDLWEEGERRAREKYSLLARHDIAVVDFGTRRRRSFAWQKHLLEMMLQDHPGLLAGTSNVLLAMQLGLPVKGTMAHELFQVVAAIEGGHDQDATLRTSQAKVLREWQETFGGDYTIALSDTFGTAPFFKDFAEFAHRWSGTRHDSGDPFDYADAVIVFYQQCEPRIDPMKKTIIFSDGLTTSLMVRLREYCADRIGAGYGWGTNNTNDVGLPMLSLAMKAIEAWGYPCVKLSDNVAKATGDSSAIDRYTRVFMPGERTHEECRY